MPIVAIIAIWVVTFSTSTWRGPPVEITANQATLPSPSADEEALAEVRKAAVALTTPLPFESTVLAKYWWGDAASRLEGDSTVAPSRAEKFVVRYESDIKWIIRSESGSTGSVCLEGLCYQFDAAERKAIVASGPMDPLSGDIIGLLIPVAGLPVPGDPQGLLSMLDDVAVAKAESSARSWTIVFGKRDGDRRGRDAQAARGEPRTWREWERKLTMDVGELPGFVALEVVTNWLATGSPSRVVTYLATKRSQRAGIMWPTALETRQVKDGVIQTVAEFVETEWKPIEAGSESRINIPAVNWTVVDSRRRFEMKVGAREFSVDGVRLRAAEPLMQPPLAALPELVARSEPVSEP